MQQVLVGLSIIALSAATPALAGSQPQGQAQPQVAQAGAPDQVICEREEDTGSRLTAHKICHTRSQWAQIRRDEQQDVQRTQEQHPMDSNGH